MAGLVPAIHVLSGRSLKDVDARTSPGMTSQAVNSDLAALLLSPAPVPASRVNHHGPARPGFCAGVQVALRLFCPDRKYTVDWEEDLRIAVLGGGPGGLYFAYLWKKRHPDATIDLFEQNAAGATWGFGVVFSEQALEFLRADHPETVDAIAPRMESWKNITLHLRGQSAAFDGGRFSSIGRLDLLDLLQQRVRA